MAVFALGDVELGEDVADVGFDGAFADDEPVGDAGVGESFGHELEYAALTLREPPDGPVIERGDEAGNDGGIEGGPTGGDAFGGGEELADLEDAVFEEVAESAVGDEGDGMGGLDVLREDEHTDLGMLLLHSAGGAGAFVGEGGRHADVDDGEIGAFAFHGGQQLVGVAERRDHLVAAVAKQPSKALAQQRLVFGDHDTHGNSARRVVPLPSLWMRRVPP
jgi:hypothetical protein